ncbi:MAG: hypothetical protein FJ317_09660 [SAR202 cluster bacterium]|nr:hypothetical protein [SAR202 cluster bacterium]
MNTEMALHVSFCEEFGITKAELEVTKPSPTTSAYTAHLLEAAGSGDAAATAVGILPCSWGYAEIGQMLKKRGLPKGQPLYGRWIETYASPEFAALAEWLRAFIDREARNLPPSRLGALEALFMESSRFEHRFWDAAYRLE